jgi:glutaryl-CoA dehydrogenase (non-decarboxylating)
MKAGWLKNQGRRSTKATSLAKWIACREAEESAANAVQVFGAYGFSDEYPVERFYRNSKGASIYEGTREIHTLMQADYALGNRFDKQLERDLPEVEQ